MSRFRKEKRQRETPAAARKQQRGPSRIRSAIASSHTRRNSSAPVRHRPVRTAILCILVVAMLCIPCIFVNTAIGYVPPIAATTLLLGCGAYLALIKRGVSFNAGQCGKMCTRGEKLQFPLLVSNRSILPAPRIEVVFYVSDIFEQTGRYERSRLTLPPRKSKEFDLGIRFDHIGLAKVGIEQILVYDPLGLFASVKENNQLEEVVVIPREIDIEPPELSDRSLREAQKTIKMFINDGMDYSGVREYHWGDPMKSIHWKLSSKATGEYYTRLYETPTMPGMAAVIDFECPDDDAERLMRVYDTVTEAALAAERHACKQGFETELLFVDEEGSYQHLKGPMKERHAEVMRRIPRISTGDGESVVELLRREITSTSCQNNIVICTCNLTKPMIEVLVTARGRSLFPYLVFVDVSPTDPARAEVYDEERKEALRHLHAAHIPYSTIQYTLVEQSGDPAGIKVNNATRSLKRKTSTDNAEGAQPSVQQPAVSWGGSA